MDAMPRKISAPIGTIPAVDPEVTRPTLIGRLGDPGDAAAWYEFDRQYRDLIIRFCRSRGLSSADAEDAHQLTLLKLSRAMPGFAYDPGRGRFRSYLYRAVRSAVADARARPNSAGRSVDTERTPEPAAEDPAAELAWEREWRDHHLRMAMATVRKSFDPQSVAIFDRLLAGEPIASVAVEFEATEQAVHKVKQRVRDRLKSLIEQQIREEEGG